MEFPIEMYKIREEETKIKVPCERCLEKGIIDRTCSKCGGNGTHSKTIKVWKVAPKTVVVEKINRSSDDNLYKGTQTSYKNGLRYWTSYYDFYNEADMFLHFTKEEAQKECDKRNNGIKDVLNINRKNHIVNVLTKPKVVYEAVCELEQSFNNMDKLLEELGCSKVIDFLEDTAIKMSSESTMTTEQALNKIFLDAGCSVNYKDVIINICSK